MRIRLLTVVVCLLVSMPQTRAERGVAPAGHSKPVAVTQVFDDWSYRCVFPAKVSETKRKNVPQKRKRLTKTCELFQSVRIRPDRQDKPLVEVLSLAVSRANDKARKIKWALVVVTPLDVHLPSRFGLSVGKEKPLTAPYRNCNRFGCWAVVPLANKTLRALRKSKDAAGLFRLLNGKSIKIVFSLKGFRRGHDSLTKGDLPVTAGKTPRQSKSEIRK